MTFREALDRKPADLDHRHESVARILIGRPEGVDRYTGARLADLTEREWRSACSEISQAGWLPIIAPVEGQGKRLYRIAQPHEADLADAASREDQSRAVSLHKRAQGRIEAFQATHSAGSLFLTQPEPLEVMS